MMQSNYRFIRTISQIINEQNHFIDFRYSKHHTIIEQKKYLQLQLIEKEIGLLQNQLFLLREGLGRQLFNRVRSQLNMLNIKISRLKKKYH